MWARSSEALHLRCAHLLGSRNFSSFLIVAGRVGGSTYGILRAGGDGSEEGVEEVARRDTSQSGRRERDLKRVRGTSILRHQDVLRVKGVFQAIEAMKRDGVIDEYAVAGAVGAIFYTEAFSTRDIDFLVHLPISESSLDFLGPIYSWLRGKGYEMNKGGSFVVEKWPVQFLPVGDELTAEALREAHCLPFEEGLEVRVVRAEYLAAEALKIGRQKDFQRVQMLILADDFNADLFEDLVKRFSLEEKWKRVESDIEKQ